MIEWLFDGLLAIGLLWLGWRTVVSAELFKAIVMFIVLGLFMALCWARLAAPDVALAEAAIGAGLIGALLLDAYRALVAERWQADDRNAKPLVAASLAILSSVLIGGLAWALLFSPEPVVDLNAQARARLADSGVGNPVTAVLLNFRGYDTLLEVGVLFLAWLGLWTVGEQESNSAATGAWVEDSDLLTALVRLLAPLGVLIGVYLLWAGANEPGGAFQAGTVLAAVGVLLRLSGRLRPELSPDLWVRFGVTVGLLVFSAIAVGVIPVGGNLLEYPGDWAGLLIVVIETSLMVSIALILTLLFIGSAGLRRGGS
ncbi:MAG: hydrogenase subunit MbhD domain-containing protein [Candidatus Competibacteraceae bacterium]|jgi:multisubunit Na+/H+ antiporter MnhB subunit|nr:hydrogenase subunit MbhD domain-containing protein [Candidatus Competibacteraceae bacterium]